MDFKDTLKQFSDRVVKLKDSIHTEEATKNALVMPFIQMLGYDVFNPLEVVPEYVCDIGTRKGGKIDYAIMRDWQPSIPIECEYWRPVWDANQAVLDLFDWTEIELRALLWGGPGGLKRHRRG